MLCEVVIISGKRFWCPFSRSAAFYTSRKRIKIVPEVVIFSCCCGATPVANMACHCLSACTTRRGFTFSELPDLHIATNNHTGTLDRGFHSSVVSKMATGYNYGQPGGWARPSRNTENNPLLSGENPPSYTSTWSPPHTTTFSTPRLTPRSTPQPSLNESCKCGARYSFLKTVCWATSIVIISTFCLLPSIITAWKDTPGKSQRPAPVLPYPTITTTTTAITTFSTTFSTTTTTTTTNSPPTAPPVPEPPYRRAGLGGNDVPEPGSAYIITEANSSKALTYDGNEGVYMTDYHKSSMAQRWGCHEADGWLGFTIETGHTTLFLGYSPWPSPATLRCSARTMQYSEMFMVSKLPEHGFSLIMKDGTALKPVGRDGSGALAMVGTSNVWWRFTKV